MKRYLLIFGVIAAALVAARAQSPYVVVLGTGQDAGVPQMGCGTPFCRKAWKDPKRRQMVSSIALVDPAAKARWIIYDLLRRIDAVRAAKNYDAVVVYREAALLGPAVIERLLGWTGRPIIYDFDDANVSVRFGEVPGLATLWIDDVLGDVYPHAVRSEAPAPLPR